MKTEQHLSSRSCLICTKLYCVTYHSTAPTLTKPLHLRKFNIRHYPESLERSSYCHTSFPFLYFNIILHVDLLPGIFHKNINLYPCFLQAPFRSSHPPSYPHLSSHMGPLIKTGGDILILPQ